MMLIDGRCSKCFRQIETSDGRCHPCDFDYQVVSPEQDDQLCTYPTRIRGHHGSLREIEGQNENYYEG